LHSPPVNNGNWTEEGGIKEVRGKAALGEKG